MRISQHWGKTNPSPLFLNGGRKGIGIQVVDWFIESKTKCGGNIRCLTIKTLIRGNIANTIVCGDIKNIHYISNQRFLGALVKVRI